MRIFIFILFFCLNSCVSDFERKAILVNNSEKQLTITIEYDPVRLDSIYKRNKVMINAYLRSLSNDSYPKIGSYDSIKLTNTFILNPNDLLNIEKAFNSIPEYSIIKKLDIISKNDSLILDKFSLKRTFKRKNSSTYEFDFHSFITQKKI